MVDLDTATIDKIEVEFQDDSLGVWTRIAPDTSTSSGKVDSYTWQNYTGYDQVFVQYDFLLDTQLFLKYTNETSGTVVAFFTTTLEIAEGTFTITNP